MSQPPTRRGLLRCLIAALFGWGATRAAAAPAPPSPPRCPHYYDGVLWASGRPGAHGYYSRDTEGCPYCDPGPEVGRPAQDPDARASWVTGSYSSYCKLSSTGDPLGPVTTYVYDTSGRPGAAPEPPPPPPA